MLAVDTNVVVRFLTHDDRVQTARADAIFLSDEVWIAKTVLLETEWVLRAMYRFTADQVAGALRDLAGMPNVRLEDPLAVARAVEWHAQGLDFADALHLASRSDAERFLTFDERFVKRAQRAGVREVVLL